MKLVSIITSTIGRPHLARAIESVKRQTYPNIQHIVAVDGPTHHERVREIMAPYDGIDVFYLPYPTRSVGGRIYAAMPHLSRGDFIMNLDDDNSLEPDHVESLVNAIGDNPWAYCLRNFVVDGMFIMRDNYNSLGLLHRDLNDVPDHLDQRFVDTGCYLLRRDIALESSRHWCAERFDDQSQFNDRDYFTALVKKYPVAPCSFKYSMNYELPVSYISWARVQNSKMHTKFDGRLPWLAK